MAVEQSHVFQNQTEIARVGQSARLPLKMTLQNEMREKRRLAKERKEQSWLKEQAEERRLKELNDNLDKLFKETIVCEARSSYLNKSVKQLREENRQRCDQEARVPDYHEKGEQIRTMVELDLQGKDPELAKADQLLKMFLGLE